MFTLSINAKRLHSQEITLHKILNESEIAFYRALELVCQTALVNERRVSRLLQDTQ